MEQVFDIADPRDDTPSGHLSFTIHDGTATIPARISAHAMQILRDDTGNSPSDVFRANKSKIRLAAYKSRRANPRLAMIVLGTGDFS
ncbi:hypothetical protein P3T18_004858 [Paraburkholderia sp. GAS199]|uniref:hypothetical protein n=1 Tax=Paraburkholderia sp. GAS199 TaxID=3035126 RepID=UPI003D1F2F5D